MSLFSSIVTSAVSSVASSRAASTVISGAVTKVSESATAIANTLGIGSQFKKLGASLPTVDQLTSSAFRGGTSELTTNPFVKQQMAMMKESYEASASAEYIDGVTGSGNVADHFVTLEDNDGRIVRFLVMPEIVESRSVQYEAVAPVQGPGAFQKFRGTDSTQWTVNATLVARNSQEATANLDIINNLRGWTMPYFGENTAAVYQAELGAPPPVLTLKGLRDKIVGPVPVVITALNWNWPRDVDYLPTLYSAEGSGLAIPFPAVVTIAIQLIESFSTTQMNNFSLSDFRNGDMVAAYNSTITG